MPDEIVGVKLQVEGGDAIKTVGELRAELAAAVNESKRIGDEFGRTSPQFKVAQSAANEIGKSLQQASMAAANVGKGIESATTPIKSMRTQIKEALQSLVSVQEQFGDISPEAQKAAQHVAELRDRLKDANEVASLFDPEKKFQAVVGVAQGIASGFAAAQGAIALFGGESKEVEQALLKVQSAMALAQGLSGVRASVEDFQRLWAVLGQISIVQKANAVANSLAAATMRLFGVATTETSIAFKVLKGAIVSTGIGFLVVGLGLLISKISDWTSSTNTQEIAQKQLNAALERQDELLKGQLSDIDYIRKLELAKAKIAGKGADDVFNINQFYRQKELESLKADWNEKYRLSVEAHKKDSKLTEEEQKKATDAVKAARDAYDAKVRESDVEASENAVRRAEEQRSKAKTDADKAEQARKSAADKATAARVADLKKIEELEKQFQEKGFAATHSAEEVELRDATLRYTELKKKYEKYGLDIANLAKDFGEEVNGIWDKYDKARADKQAEAQQKLNEDQAKEDQADAARVQERIAAQTEAVDLIANNEKLSFDTRRDLLEQFHQDALAMAEANGQSQTEIDSKFSEARKSIARAEREVRVREGQAVAGALDSFAALAGEQTAAGKALAVTSATISAILGAQQAFTALAGIPYVGPVLGGIAAAGALAAGYANVKKILAVQVPGSTGGAGSMPGIGSTAPLSPPTNTSQSVKLDQQSINDMGNGAFKTYVLESDISITQGRITRVQQAAEFK